MNEDIKLKFDSLRVTTDAKLDGYIERIYRDIPYASHQKDADKIDMEYYKRHSIETPIRIKLKRTIDALVIHYFTKHNPKAAKDWANYTDDEMLHGHMFAKDIERLWGLSFEEVMAHEPLFATQLLNGYFYFHLEYEGPMAAIASAYFLEYVTARTQPEWLDNLQSKLGDKSVAGARAHVNLDLEEDHSGFVWETLMATVKSEDDIVKLNKHFDRIFGLFCAYLVEVYQSTAGKNEDNPLMQAPIAAVNFSEAVSA
ncbi:hypothetical protein [Teredinibacter purpureus]|uniref:hypothetical protein n=1 Tax=Teredinibacter purpureus TaxID=2731756 RepID=UPI0005F80F3A|nr:hypothetical protein [Teredinibacter purpureus]